MSQNNQKSQIRNTIERIDAKHDSPYTVNRRFSVVPMIDDTDL